MELTSKISGEFSFFYKDENNNEIPVFNKPSKNMILDAFLDRLHANTSGNSYSFSTGYNSNNGFAGGLSVGTGTTPVAANDTGLKGTELGYARALDNSGSWTISHDVPSDQITIDFVRRFEVIFTSTGNVSEVAVYHNESRSPSTIISRALIYDEVGNPTSIPITNIDTPLVIYWRVKVTYLRTITSSVNINGVPTDITLSLHKSSAISANNSEFEPWLMPNGYTYSMLYQSSLQSSTIPPLVYNPASNGATTINSSYTVVIGLTPANSTSGRVKRRLRILPFAFDTDTFNSGQGTSKIFWQFGSGIYLSMNFSPYLIKNNKQLFDIEIFTRTVRA